jgi:WD40 repeat protein
MTSHRPPQYRLQRVFDNGHSSAPRVYRLDAYEPCKPFGRRDFLKTTALPFSALLAPGCGGGGGGSSGTAADPDAVNAAFRAGVRAHFGMRQAKFSPDAGRLVATIGDDAQLKLWQADHRPAAAFTAVSETHDFAFSADGALIAVATAYNVAVYDTRSFALIHVFDVADFAAVRRVAEIRDMAFTPDGKIVVNTELPGIHYWDYASRAYVGGFTALSNTAALYMSMRPQGDAVLVGGGSGTFELRAFPSGSLLGTFTTGGAFLIDVGFSPDGNSFVATETAGPNKLTIWDYATRSIRHRVIGSFTEAEIHSFVRLVFLPDGRLVGAANRNVARNFQPTAVIIDVNTGTLTRADGLIGLDEVSPDATRYLSDGLHESWVGGSCGSHQRVQLLTGRLELNTPQPALLDATPMFSPDATELGRQTAFHSAVNDAGQTIYVASDPSLGLPANATCTCNSVGGTGTRNVKSCGTGGGGGTCTCNTVCICVPVFY